MGNFNKQFKEEADQIKLSAAEKATLKSRLVAFTEFHPLGDYTVMKVEEQPVRLVRFGQLWFVKWSGVALLMLFLVVPVVAEKAVPGDVLYPVKVNFNEEVRGSLASGSSEKVAWETERLNRRLAEANLLEKEGRLTEEIEDNVAKAVLAHSDKAQKVIANLKNTDKEEALLASLRLEAVLELQQLVLRHNEVEGVVMEEKELNFSERIANLLEKQSGVGEVSLTAGKNLSEERLAGQIEKTTTRIEGLLAGTKNTFSESERFAINRRLTDIKNALVTGNVASAEEGVVNNNTENLLLLLKKTEWLGLYIAESRIRTVVTLDEIIPIVLTTEERWEKVMSDWPLVGERLAALTAWIEDEADEELLEKSEKIRLDLPEYQQAWEEMENLIKQKNTSDLPVVEEELVKINAWLDDTEKILGKIDVATIPVVGDGELEEELATTTKPTDEEADSKEVENGEEINPESEEVASSTKPAEVSENVNSEIPVATEEGTTTEQVVE